MPIETALQLAFVVKFDRHSKIITERIKNKFLKTRDFNTNFHKKRERLKIKISKKLILSTHHHRVYYISKKLL